MNQTDFGICIGGIIRRNTTKRDASYWNEDQMHHTQLYAVDLREGNHDMLRVSDFQTDILLLAFGIIN